MPPKKQKEDEAAAIAAAEAAEAAALEHQRELEQMGLRLRDLVRQGNLQELQRIAEEHEDVCDVNFQDKHGWTILHYAARNGQLQASDWLIRQGAHVGKVDLTGLTPLMYACRNGHFEIAKLLCHSGANIHFCDVNEANPLHYAVQWGHPEIVQLLLNSQADVMAANMEGKTPLHLAAEAGNGKPDQKSIRLLLEHGADGQTALDNNGFSAEECSCSPFLRTLIQEGSPGRIKALKQTSKIEAHAVFGVLDHDNKGYLEPEELRAQLVAMGCCANQVSKVFSQVKDVSQIDLDRFVLLFKDYSEFLYQISGWMQLNSTSCLHRGSDKPRTPHLQHCSKGSNCDHTTSFCVTATPEWSKHKHHEQN